MCGIFGIYPHAVYLKQQLETMQQEGEHEQQSSRREVMKLRDRLLQAYQERDRARAEVERLGDALEGAAAAKVMLESQANS